MGRDWSPLTPQRVLTDFNPRAPCGARLLVESFIVVLLSISIHAPRVGRDLVVQIDRAVLSLFQSTRPVWGATQLSYRRDRTGKFQSTRPVWGATLSHSVDLQIWGNFNPRAPCGARHQGEGISPLPLLISIHAPRVGRDSKFDDFTPSNLHKRYKRVLARPKNTREKGKIKQKLAYIHAFSAFLGCEGSGTFCALVLRTQYR